MNGKPPCCIACSKGAIHLKTFEITRNNQIVGSAEVCIEGLYYKISCRCQLPAQAMYRIYMVSEDVKIDLGVCIPKDNQFILTKRIPIKQIGKSVFTFYVYEKKYNQEDFAMPLANDKTFPYIDQLERAYLEIRNKQPYIIIPSKAIDPR